MKLYQHFLFTEDAKASAIMKPRLLSYCGLFILLI